MKRKIILNVAMSLDGYIADENGGFEWIVGDGEKELDTKDQFDFNVFLKDIDTVVTGYTSFKDAPMEMLSSQRVIVATSREKKNYDNVEFVNSNIVSFVEELRKQEGKDIWLFGGSLLADAFMKENVVDEFIIGVIPIILGDGIRLFKEANPMIPLQLTAYTVGEGIAILRYTRRS